MCRTSLVYDEVEAFEEETGADLKGSLFRIAETSAGVAVSVILLGGEMDQAIFLDRPAHLFDEVEFAVGVVLHMCVPLSVCRVCFSWLYYKLTHMIDQYRNDR